MTDRIAELRNLIKLATSGPWDANGPAWNRVVWSSLENRICFMAHSNGLNDDRDIANSRLIAQAPTLAADLAAALEANARLRAALVEARDDLEAWASHKVDLEPDGFDVGYTEAVIKRANAVLGDRAALVQP